MSSSGILKRGYLFDKKVGILPMTVDRKRWYILRQDLTQGHQVILEFYKDEKAASKGDTPKGFINIHDVVTVQRVIDKKQSFEILCPGIGYRLMANSELEADEWTEAIRNHISYKRDDGTKSLSLTRVQGSASHNHFFSDRQRTLSDPHPSHLHPSSFHQHQLLQPRSIPIVATHQHRSIDAQAMLHLAHNYPTPPESLSSPTSLPTFHMPGSFQRQRSLELAAPFPSPSTSSDSSSMCSGSNTSFEGGGAVFEPDGMEMKSVFRVQVKEAENLNFVGPADLEVTEDGLRLQSISPDPHELVFWPLGSLRRYGVSSHCFTIITGRFCATGEGRFQFYTDESRLIHAKVHSYAAQKAASSGRGKSMPRRSSESNEFSGRSPQQATPLHYMNPTHSLPSQYLSTSPPVMFTQSTEIPQEYSRLHHCLAPGTVPTHHSAGGGMYSHAPTQPISVGPQRVSSQQFMTHYSPTMHYHTTQTPANNINISSLSLQNISQDSPDSNPSLPTQSENLDQTMLDKEVRSELSGSNSPSAREVESSSCPIPDQEDVNAIQSGATATN